MVKQLVGVYDKPDKNELFLASFALPLEDVFWQQPSLVSVNTSI